VALAPCFTSAPLTGSMPFFRWQASA